MAQPVDRLDPGRQSQRRGAAVLDDVWVVGDSILHWDGNLVDRLPAPAAANYLAGVWGTGPDDAWIVGSTGTLLHWNGTTWSVVPTAGIRQ